MITVKPKIASLIILTLIMMTALAGTTAYADSVSQTIRLTITVVGTLSLNIDENALPALAASANAGEANSGKPEAEAFSEMRNHNIVVSKLVRDNSNLWLFTKTE
jgi:hypothetical protein